MYGGFSSTSFRFMFEDSMNNRILEHWSFTQKYSVEISCMNSIIKDTRCISLLHTFNEKCIELNFIAVLKDLNSFLG